MKVVTHSGYSGAPRLVLGGWVGMALYFQIVEGGNPETLLR